MRPSFYDFKKTSLRVFSILILIIFILSGVGMAYQTIQVSQLVPSDYENLNVMGYVYVSPNYKVSICGIVFNNQGKPIPSATIYILSSGKVIASTETLTNGFFNITVKYAHDLYLLVKYNGLERSINISSIISPIGIIFRYNQEEGGPIVNQTLVFYDISLFRNDFDPSYLYNVEMVIMSNNNLVIFPHDNSNITLEFVHSSYILNYRIVTPLKSLNLSLRALTPIYITVNIPPMTNCIIVPVHIYYNLSPTILPSPIHSNVNLTILPSPNALPREFNFTIQYSNYTIIYSKIMPNFITFLSIFMLFLPFVIIYLAYTSFARLRSTGELEFILARPITKCKIFISRFFANVLIATISSFLLITTTAMIFSIKIGLYLPIHVILLISLIPLSSLLSYLAITYMYSTIIKSGAIVLGLGFFTYIITQIVIPVIGIITNTYNEITNYLVPGSLQYYIQGWVTGDNVKVNVELEIISTILWIIIPSIISYVIVKKRDM
ncbi:ABC transporter permease [Saccharolobus islandicus]|uniref:Uncharacterized protein n=2 Tax=Saccharolobus islandicus TaxID=43080 RepID=F0NDW1_SACI5|nr:ABC transporter permease [Sulfolobus islandicus]ADX84670.1 hypothetical protein SiRe_0587 [Sulfolobus islandicus REY15A]